MATGCVKVRYAVLGLIGDSGALQVTFHHVPGLLPLKFRKQKLTMLERRELLFQHGEQLRVDRQHVLAAVF